jgi:hypothetical protein
MRDRWNLRQALQRFLNLGLGPFAREIFDLRNEFATLRVEANRVGVAQSEVTAAMKAAVKDLRERILQPLHDFMEATFFSDSPAGGTPMAQFEAIREDFLGSVASALSGDVDAISDLPGQASTLRDLAEQLFGSGAAFQSIWTLIQDQLTAVEQGLNIDLSGGVATPTWEDQMLSGIHGIRDAIVDQTPYLQEIISGTTYDPDSGLTSVWQSTEYGTPGYYLAETATHTSFTVDELREIKAMLVGIRENSVVIRHNTTDRGPLHKQLVDIEDAVRAS